MDPHITKGFDLGSEARLKAVEAEGVWSVWIEKGGLPLCLEHGKPILFCGSTLYQAQCQAVSWYEEKSGEANFWNTGEEWIVG